MSTGWRLLRIGLVTAVSAVLLYYWVGLTSNGGNVWKKLEEKRPIESGIQMSPLGDQQSLDSEKEVVLEPSHSPLSPDMVQPAVQDEVLTSLLPSELNESLEASNKDLPVVCTDGSYLYDSDQLPDVACRLSSADMAAVHFLTPILSRTVETRFFRYFYVDLGRECPFEAWQGEGGLCMSPGCQVGEICQDEVPWCDADAAVYSDSITGGNQGDWDRVEVALAGKPSSGGSFLPSELMGINAAQKSSRGYLQFLHENEDCYADDQWIEMLEGHSPPPPTTKSTGVYVDLIQNPERYTGYSGPPAWKMWAAIREENCFGDGLDDTCMEKRVFHRVVSGLQASITTHIARQYLYAADGGDDPFTAKSTYWDVNLQLYVDRVGRYRERVDNMYFTFLFLLRAAVRARPVLLAYPYHTGNSTEEAELRNLMDVLTSIGTLEPAIVAPTSGVEDMFRYDFYPLSRVAANECSNGFDEQKLFQADPSTNAYFRDLAFKADLKEEFRERFRNISRIMDCVHCEKCRLWGKVQILGIGTAIKLLLTPEEDWSTPELARHVLNRQETVAFVNTLKQLTNSIAFAATYGHEATRRFVESERTAAIAAEAREVLEAKVAAELSTATTTDGLPNTPEEIANDILRAATEGKISSVFSAIPEDTLEAASLALRTEKEATQAAELASAEVAEAQRKASLELAVEQAALQESAAMEAAELRSEASQSMLSSPITRTST